MATPPQTHSDNDELFIGYVPPFHRVTGWNLSFRQRRAAPHGGVVRRVMFDNADDPHMRLLVDVADLTTPERAREYLKAAIADANFEIDRGPDRFGSESIAYPKDTPHALRFSRANLSVWIYAYGRQSFRVDSWADRVLEDLAQNPQSRLDPSMLYRTPDADQSQAIRLRVTLPWESGEWAWRRFKATGGTLSRSAEGDDVLFWPDPAPAESSVVAWAFEPGREPYMGQYTHKR